MLSLISVGSRYVPVQRRVSAQARLGWGVLRGDLSFVVSRKRPHDRWSGVGVTAVGRIEKEIDVLEDLLSDSGIPRTRSESLVDHCELREDDCHG